MRRPRHREKSSLLWKMLGVAGVINLLLWPVLIHAGVFAGIRQEVLIPVRLISLPPSHKQPDTLQKIARAAPPALLPLAHAMPVHVPSAAIVKASAVPTATLARPKTPAARVAASPTFAPLTPAIAAVAVKPPMPASRKPITQQAPPPLHAAPHPARVAQAKRVVSVKHPVPDTDTVATADMGSAARVALRLRVARAKQLEAEGHQVAEWIARQRAARLAALPPPTPPDTAASPAATPASPVMTATSDVAPGSGEATRDAASAAMTLTPRAAAPPTPRKVAPVALLTPPVIVSKAYPSVPDAMMKSSWHTMFHGKFTVHPDGSATVRLVSSTGFPILDRRAMQAARRWRFRPARLNGRPVTTSQAFAFDYDVHPLR